MVRLVEFDEATEARVRFIEDTPREEIVAKTLARLDDGEDPRALVTAAALAVSRSTELPADHHGGPVHPVSGVHAIMGLISRLQPNIGMTAAVQSVALANKHIHLPSMGPAAMVAFDDLKRSADTDVVLDRLESAVKNRQPRLAERAVTLACEKATPGQILNRLLTVALPRNSLDDHYLLYTIYAARALDAIGWQWGDIVLRPVVRFLSRHASFDMFGEFDEESIHGGIRLHERFHELQDFIDQYGLTPETVPVESSPGESDAIAALADKIAAVDVISSLPRTIAEGMAGGLSMLGTCEAMSIGGARLFLRSHTGNPFDVHIHTGIAARRYLLQLPEIDFEKKLASLFGWPWGYEVRYLDHTLNWEWQNDAGTLSSAGETNLLADIENRILALPGFDMLNLPTQINLLVAPDEVRTIVRLAESYVKAGFDVDRLFALSASLVCREDASEMHAYTIQQAAYEEYHTCREPYRWVHAVSAVKQASVTVPMKPTRVFAEISAARAA